MVTEHQNKLVREFIALDSPDGMVERILLKLDHEEIDWFKRYMKWVDDFVDDVHSRLVPK